jgi:hypothetical protein
VTDLFELLEPAPAPEPERFHRRSDPQPSKVAAEKGDSFGPVCRRVLATLIEVERTTPSRGGATASEIQLRMSFDAEIPPDRNSISRRLTSLLRKGYVRDTGERRDGGRGVEVTVYAATPEGRTWLAAA